MNANWLHDEAASCLLETAFIINRNKFQPLKAVTAKVPFIVFTLNQNVLAKIKAKNKFGGFGFAFETIKFSNLSDRNFMQFVVTAVASPIKRLPAVVIENCQVF